MTEAGTLPIIVLDLDSTLFDTAPRNLRILREFAANNHHKPDIAAVVDTMSLADMGWNVTGALKKAGVDDEEVLAALKKFWAQRFYLQRSLVPASWASDLLVEF